MKKVFALITLLLATPLYADTQTAGSMKLIQPSTNTVDKNRSWADKLNENFKIIDSTVTAIINGQFGTSGEPQSFILFKDTAQAKIQNLAIATGTIADLLSQRTHIFNEEGSPLSGGNVTSVNCVGSGLTCSQVASTVTVTVTATGSGGGGQRTFDVVIGTAGALGADYTSNNFTASLNQALSDRGGSISSTNTVPLSVYVQRGVYGLDGSTVPRSVTLYTIQNPSGTIFSMQHDSHTMITNYGVIDGFVFDGGSRSFTGVMVEMKDNSELKNCTFIGAQAMTNYNRGSALVAVRRTSETYVHDNWFKEYHGCAGRTYQGECGTYIVEDSTNAYFYRNKLSSPAYVANDYETICSNVRSVNSQIKDNFFEGAFGDVMSMGTGKNLVFSGNTLLLGAGGEGDGGNYGLVTLDGSDEVPPVASSSANVIANNYFFFVSTGGAPGNIIRARSGAEPPRNGVSIFGNVVMAPQRTNWTFYTMAGGPEMTNTILRDNAVYNLERFISDSGAETKYLNLGNSFDGKMITGPDTTLNGSTSTISLYDEGVEESPITTLNFVGAAVDVTVSGTTGTITVTASGGAGGSDNLGSHVATRPVVMSGYAVNYATAVTVGTQTYSGAAIAISTTPDTTKSLFVAGIDSTSVFDIRKSSVLASGPVIVGSEPVNGLTVTNGFISSIGSATFTNGTDGIGGGVSAASYTIRGYSIFGTTWNPRTYDGYIIRYASGSIPANSSRTFTASTNFSFSEFGLPMCMEIKGGAAPGLPLYIEDTITLTTFALTNPDITNAQKFICHVPGKPSP